MWDTVSLVEFRKSILEGRQGRDLDLREEPVELLFRSAFELSVAEYLTPLRTD